MWNKNAFCSHRCLGIVLFACNLFLSSGIYTGAPKLVWPGLSNAAGCHAAYVKGYRGNCNDHLQLKIGGAMNSTAESEDFKAKGVAEYGMVQLNRVREYIHAHGGQARYTMMWTDLSNYTTFTRVHTNNDTCGQADPCVQWLITPFGEDHTIKVLKEVADGPQKIFNSFVFIWSTSNDVVYDTHCVGKGCWGLLPTWKNYLNGAIDTVTADCRAALNCATTFKFAIVENEKSQTKYLTAPAKAYLQSFNASSPSMITKIGDPNSLIGILDTLQKETPHLVIIGASGGEIGKTVEAIANTKYRPRAIVAVNTDLDAGKNFLNIVNESDFQSAKWKQCVGFPIYYDPNAPNIDSIGHIAQNAAEFNKWVKTNATKYTAHLFAAMASAYQGVVWERMSHQKTYSFRQEVDYQCRPYPTFSSADIASKTAYPVTKTCRGITYDFQVDFQKQCKPVRPMLISQLIGACDITKGCPQPDGITSAAGEHISGRTSLGRYADIAKTVVGKGQMGNVRVIQGSKYQIRDLKYDVRPMMLDIGKNIYCKNWEVKVTTTTTTTSTAKISGSNMLKVGTVIMSLGFRVIWQLVSL